MENAAAEPDNDDDETGGRTLSGLTSSRGRLAYVVGPIRGRLDLLRELVAKLVADALAAKPAARPHLIFLGDYLGAAAGTAEVAAFILDLRSRPIFKVHALQGRSDRAFLNFLEWPGPDAPWMAEMDGEATLAAYKVDVPAARAEPQAWTEASNQLRAALSEADLAFLKSLETLVTIGDYAFVHGGLRPERDLDDGPGEIQWIRGSPFRQGYTVERAKGGRPRTGQAVFALRIQDTRQTVFQTG